MDESEDVDNLVEALAAGFNSLLKEAQRLSRKESELNRRVNLAHEAVRQLSVFQLFDLLHSGVPHMKRNND